MLSLFNFLYRTASLSLKDDDSAWSAACSNSIGILPLFGFLEAVVLLCSEGNRFCRTKLFELSANGSAADAVIIVLGFKLEMYECSDSVQDKDSTYCADTLQEEIL